MIAGPLAHISACGVDMMMSCESGRTITAVLGNQPLSEE
jgi:hypothetical protein